MTCDMWQSRATRDSVFHDADWAWCKPGIPGLRVSVLVGPLGIVHLCTRPRWCTTTRGILGRHREYVCVYVCACLSVCLSACMHAGTCLVFWIHALIQPVCKACRTGSLLWILTKVCARVEFASKARAENFALCVTLCNVHSEKSHVSSE